LTAPNSVHDLVDRFDRNIEAYRSGKYNETQVRREFIDPFFIALGWDVNNEKGYAEAYKDVVHEDAIKIGSATKAPDYCFRIGGTRKFFLEAKKPSVSIKDDVHPAYQLRRYAWSAKLPLSILTDFEEFAVFDCRIKPNSTDKPSTARILYIKYTEYADRWDEIASRFSQDAVLKGSFDKYVESAKRKKGTAEVDTAFLKEIEVWRDVLARNIAIRNPGLTQRELNFAVQRTIDRIIFLRICEDRGIESYGRLMAEINGPRVYARLCQLFRHADDRYNSGLFHFHTEKDRIEPPDELTLHLKIDDKVLKDIIKNLYYPESPYEFSVLPADILGQVYEQFLGKVIRLTKGHRAVVEDKPEVKKAGGVYYTPTYIVDYIVKNTVGKLVEGKTPAQMSGTRTKRPIRILDPACGSGSFLIGAYQYLLDWYRDWYSDNDPEKWMRRKNPPIYLHGRRGTQREGETPVEPSSNPGCGSAGASPSQNAPSQRSPSQRSRSRYEYRLTTAERKRILLTHIYGVDIDQQAVEVTKLSLLLKVLEGENEETVSHQLALFHDRALPDLSNNIKCGNSLIGPDFYDGQQMSLLDDDERYRINVFDWNAEFPAVFSGRNPGFDAVIGNPPYGSYFLGKEAEYYGKHYEVFAGVKDVYNCFIEKAGKLIRKEGKMSFIVPSAWMGGPRYGRLRTCLLSKRIDAILLLPFDVFAKAYVDTAIFIVTHDRPAGTHEVKTFIYGKRDKPLQIELSDVDYNRVRQVDWLSAPDQKFVLDVQTLRLLTRIRSTCPRTLEDVAKIKRGVLFDSSLLTEKPEADLSFPYFEGDVYRYRINLVTESWIEFGDKMKEKPRESIWFEGPRILLRRLVNRRQRLMAALAEETFITNKNLYSILVQNDVVDIRLLLGIVNSKLLSHLYLSQVTQATKDDFPQVTIRDMLALPFPSTNSVAKHTSQMITLVDQMLELHKQLAAAKTAHDKTVLERQIEATDRQIDRLVYEMYELTEEEVRIFEEST